MFSSAITTHRNDFTGLINKAKAHLAHDKTPVHPVHSTTFCPILHVNLQVRSV